MRWGRGAERLDEVDDYGALDGGESAVPDEINGEITSKGGAVVVFENEWLWLDKG